MRIQSTPNPWARKYIVHQLLKTEGKASYKDAQSCQHIPLFFELLQLKGIIQVHVFQTALTVTQDGSYLWPVLDQAIQTLIFRHLDHHDPDFPTENPNLDLKPPRILDPELQAIDNILSQTIRPSLQSDGGDVEVLEFKNHILTIAYQGACGGCPSSMSGTLDGITHILRNSYDPHIQVVVV